MYGGVTKILFRMLEYTAIFWRIKLLARLKRAGKVVTNKYVLVILTICLMCSGRIVDDKMMIT